MNRAKSWGNFAFVFFIILSASSLGLEVDVRSKLEKRIEEAKNELDTELNTILNEKKSYSKKLNTLQKSVDKLNNQAKNLQRLEDEQLLSLDSLKIRTQKWEEQLNYQSHLLTTFGDLINLKKTVSNNEHSDFPEIKILLDSIENIEKILEPGWELANVATKSGVITEVNSLKVGPIYSFLDQSKEFGGLYESDFVSGENIEFYRYSNNQLSEVQKLLDSKQASIMFDPTLGRAIEIINNEDTLIDHIKKGGIWVFPIIFFGFIALIVAILKFLQIYKLKNYSEELTAKIEHIVQKKPEDALVQLKNLLKDVSDPLYRLANTVLHMPASNEREDLLFSHLNNERHRVEKYLDVISITTAVAPLLGLLGTVSGMIDTFKMLTIFGSGDPAAISGGISEALVTTELGLIVAIPSLIVNALLARRVKSHIHGLENQAINLNNITQKTI